MSGKNKDGQTEPAADNKVLDELREANTQLTDQVTTMGKKIDEILAEKANDGAKSVADSVKTLVASVQALAEDETVDEEERNKQLVDASKQIQEVFAKLTGASMDPKAQARLDSVKATTNATKGLADAMANMTSDADRLRREEANVAELDSILANVGADESFTDEQRTSLRAKLVDKAKVVKEIGEVKDLITDVVDTMNMGRASERLIQMGYTPKPAQGQTGEEEPVADAAPRIEVPGKDFLAGVALLSDKCTETGHWEPHYDVRKEKCRVEDVDMHPGVKQVVDQYDKMFAGELRRELDHMKKAGGGVLTDQSVHADFETPYTIMRMVLAEAYADQIMLGITDFGSMSNDREQIPISRWRRESNSERTYRPSLQARTEIKVGELQPIPRGKLTTEWFPIDAESRKLQTTLSDEYITRARRRPDIAGMALALRNLRDDIMRSFEQDVFYEILRGALENDAVAFVSAQTADGTTSTWQVTSATNQAGDPIAVDPDDAQTIVPESLTQVDVNSIAVPEFGTSLTGGGPGAAFWYVQDHALGLITFVDAAGAANPPTATHPIDVAGQKAGGVNANRFDMTDPAGVDHDVHMNDALFLLQNLVASMSEGSGYDPNILISNRINATLLQQAKAYTPEARRRAFRGDGPVVDGNFGVTSDLNHFASRVFPANFLVIGMREACIWRVYEPINLRGPIEARNEPGAELIGGKEWYTYQEDALNVPIGEKYAVITTYNT